VIETALSAGFYVALACDHIVASPAATLGGCGAILRLPSLDALATKLGLTYRVVTSGAHKDSLFPLGELEQEQLVALESLVRDHSSQFLQFVEARRPIDGTILDRVSAGQLLSGRDAFDLKLIDENGGLFSAIVAAGRIIGTPNVTIQVIKGTDGRHSVDDEDHRTMLSTSVEKIHQIISKLWH
jgi:protease-4